MRRTLVTLSFLIVATLFLTACGLLQEVEEASGTIEAIPLEVATATAVESDVEAEPTDPPTEAPPTAAPEQDEPTAYPAPDESNSEVTEAAEAYPAPAGGLKVYQIDQAGSSVRFELDEDLRGQLNAVVGITDQLAGEIALDLSDLSTVQVGIIQINARTLATDNSFRNRAINNEILDTDSYEFITFTPTSVDGMPASTNMDEEVNFTITGDLTIRDITQPAVFEVSATAVSDTQLVGSARAVVLRSDYDLRIPSVPSVANVEEEVELYIDFVANAV